METPFERKENFFCSFIVHLYEDFFLHLSIHPQSNGSDLHVIYVQVDFKKSDRAWEKGNVILWNSGQKLLQFSWIRTFFVVVAELSLFSPSMISIFLNIYCLCYMKKSNLILALIDLTMTFQIFFYRLTNEWHRKKEIAF